MPKFMTISPTHVPGRKGYAWNKFRDGNYVAIGWLHGYDLTGKSLNEIIALIREQNYDNEASGIDAFTKFLALEIGDYVAVNNTNDGLFGIGVISSGYKYERYKHDTGADDKEDFYPHFREVQWKYTSYVRRKDIISPGETAWKPFGTVGNLENEIPPYVQRLLGIMPSTKQLPPKSVVPEHLRTVISRVERLRTDPNHQERAHESLVEDFFNALGYEKHRDIKYRQGRVDISLWDKDRVLVIVEVKKDWNLSFYNSPDAVQQAYKYALDQGARWVILTNGDYYAVFDRLKGLTLSSNLIGEFRLTVLGESDVDFIQRMSRDNLLKPKMEELFRHLSECF
jgi:Holliday junction resolvase-like predicted endonuclease